MMKAHGIHQSSNPRESVPPTPRRKDEPASRAAKKRKLDQFNDSGAGSGVDDDDELLGVVKEEPACQAQRASFIKPEASLGFDHGVPAPVNYPWLRIPRNTSNPMPKVESSASGDIHVPDTFFNDFIQSGGFESVNEEPHYTHMPENMESVLGDGSSHHSGQGPQGGVLVVD
jgi:hypothetical protein